jgi:hypothetical protein
VYPSLQKSVDFFLQKSVDLYREAHLSADFCRNLKFLQKAAEGVLLGLKAHSFYFKPSLKAKLKIKILPRPYP